MSKLEEIRGYVIRGRAKLITAAVQEALDDGEKAPDILNCMIDAMDEIGDGFRKGEIFVPEMLVAARTMKKGVEVLRPVLTGGETASLGKIILGTVAGDLHDIGKNLVGLMFESAGFEVIDLGVDVSKEKYLEAYKANPDTRIIALSALLTTAMPAMEETVALFNEQSFRHDVKIMVGGAPITGDYARQIGADAYTADAASAAEKAREIIA